MSHHQQKYIHKDDQRERKYNLNNYYSKTKNESFKERESDHGSRYSNERNQYKDRYRKRSISSNKNKNMKRSYSRSSSDSQERKRLRKRNKRSRSRSRSDKKKSSPSPYQAIKKVKTTSQYKNNDSLHQKKEELMVDNTPLINFANLNKKPEKDLSNTILVSDLGVDVNLNILEDTFNDKSLECHTSMPENIKFLESLRVAYVIFPSIPVATQIMEYTGGRIFINGNTYTLEYTPNLINNNLNPNTNKTSVTYITNIGDNSQYTTSMETTVHEDWICEFCDCKNFSKRIVCFKCLRPKTINCRIIPVIKQKTTVMGDSGQVPPSTCLMIRGFAIKETNESELLEIFSQYAQVKDIRLISDKITGEIRDYAFVDYFSIEEATNAINNIKRNPIKLRNNPIFVTFSKIKRTDEVKDTIDINRNRMSDNSFDGNQFQQYTGNNLQSYQGFDPINSINPLNLTLQDQNKFANISYLQNQINMIHHDPILINPKENVGQSNLRREKELSEREKVELQMKSWNRKQEKKKPQTEERSSEKSLKSTVNYDTNFSIGNYDTVISIDQPKVLQEMSYDISKIVNIDKTTMELIIDAKQQKTYICHLCQRKFECENKLQAHEKYSSLHKDNLKKQSV